MLFFPYFPYYFYKFKFIISIIFHRIFSSIYFVHKISYKSHKPYVFLLQDNNLHGIHIYILKYLAEHGRNPLPGNKCLNEVKRKK